METIEKGYASGVKKDPFYQFAMNVQDASDDESEEILSEIERLSDDDLAIASTKQFFV